MTCKHRFYFRVDSSLKLGMGHVMRCLVLAKALRRRGADCIFLSAPLFGNVIHIIVQNQFKVVELSVEGGDVSNLEIDWKTDAFQVSSILKNKDFDWLIVDHYELDYRWEKGLSIGNKKIFVIDDISDRTHYCGAILNNSLNARQIVYPKSIKKFLGPAFTLVGEELTSRTLIARNSKKVLNILVAFGAADFFGQCEKVIRALKKIENIKAHVIIGKCHVDEGVLLSCSDENVYVETFTNRMQELMRWADLGIGTCGQMAWERCIEGLPAIVVINTPSQEAETLELDRIGVVKCLGYAKEVESEDWHTAINAIMENPKEVRSLSKKAQYLASCFRGGLTTLISFLLPSS